MSCSIRAEITEPDPFHPRRGFVVPNIELGPLCHSGLRAGPPSDMQQTIAFSLLQIIQNDSLLHLEDLCIEESKAVWVLYVDIICLSHSGSLLTGATCAMVAALLSTSLPVARWDLDADAVRCKHEYAPLKLGILPHVLEFGVFDRMVIADMTDEEEILCTEKLTVIMDSQNNVLALSKSGGSGLNSTTLDQVLLQAEQRIKFMDNIIRSSQKYRL
ncbi:protein of unknown function [Taphrina deformans PYCC 5710]|uniref:Ribosomal RNA-processing protein 43 n=1 Tax=Taphrina deformans (strain PYCC 5710 / ATCC 11124 / CBS 356.35 / IMI 108563 / JCM 9778 / NBRC 8474) TaxID=1097556 RepID=R4XIK2_TAPDE|nr:protein of unknown function [Taphrina deformans PYCC 5710]|eukprot:CCG84329.1 protein of unknown function [Taphrina deformans PYCC 5710]